MVHIKKEYPLLKLWLRCGHRHPAVGVCVCGSWLVFEWLCVLEESSTVVMVTLGFRRHHGRTGCTIAITTTQLLCFHSENRSAS